MPEEFNRDTIKLILLAIFFLIAAYLLPKTDYAFFQNSDVSFLILMDILSFFGLFSGLMAFYYFFKWMYIRRHKNTKLFMRIMTTGLAISYILAYMYFFSYNEIYLTIISITYVINFLIALAISKRNSWITVLPKKQKLQILFTTFLLMALSFAITEVTLDRSMGIYNVLNLFMPGIHIIAGSTFIFSTAYSLRIFFSVLGSLPSTQIVEHQTHEINSLTHLNRVVANTKDFYKLIDDVSFLALNASGGAASWIEVYGKDGKITYCSPQFIEKDIVCTLHKNENYSRFIMSLTKPVLIDSIIDFKNKQNHLLKLREFANSIIIVPLFTNEDRYGTLYAVHPDDYGFETEDLNVLSAFDDNLGIAIENAKLVAESVEKEKYKQELMLARDMQKKLLPQVLPEIEFYSLAAFSIPAEEIGGDYYDIVYLQNGKPCLLIGDVSGKGMTASFYMAQLKGVVLAEAKDSNSGAELLSRINSTLVGAMEKQMYITMEAVVIDDDDGNLTISRAGHMPVLVSSNETVKLLTPQGIGIGLVNGTFFDNTLEEIKVKLKKNDKCLLLTDGVNELRNTENIEMGYNSLKQILKKTVYNNAGDVVEEIKKYVTAFSGAISPHDDMTIVNLVYKGK